MSQPVALSEQQMLALLAASHPLPADSRSAFLEHCARELAALPELGEGAIARAITGRFHSFFRPSEIPEEPQQLRKLSFGSNKLATRYDVLEARRTRRERSDAQ